MGRSLFCYADSFSSGWHSPRLGHWAQPQEQPPFPCFQFRIPRATTAPKIPNTTSATKTVDKLGIFFPPYRAAAATARTVR